MKNIIAGFLIVLLTITVNAQDKTVSKSFPNIKSIRIQVGSGSIDLKKGNGTDVKVEVRYSYDPSRYEPTFDVNGSKLSLGEDFERGNNSGSSQWSLEIPDGIDVDFTTGSGNISAIGLTTNLTGNAGSGDIYLSNIKGELDFNTGSGEIEIEKVDGEIKLNTGSGQIRAKNCSGFLSINAGSGDIRLQQSSADFKLNTGSGDIRANDIKLTGSSSFNTGSGNALIALAGPLNYNISVNSGSGDSTLDFKGNDISGTVVMTANKRGGEIIAPFKFDSEKEIDDYNSSPRIEKTAKLGSKDITIRVSTGSGTAEIAK